MELINFHINKILDFLSGSSASVPFSSFWVTSISLLISIFFLIGLTSFITARPKALSHNTLILGVIGLIIYLSYILLNNLLPVNINSRVLRIELFSSLSLGLFGGFCAIILNFLEQFLSQLQSNRLLIKYLKELIILLRKNHHQSSVNELDPKALKKINESMLHVSKQVYDLTKMVNSQSHNSKISNFTTKPNSTTPKPKVENTQPNTTQVNENPKTEKNLYIY